MKELTAFYGILAGINFTLLGLWWVTVQERPHLRSTGAGSGRAAYIISLQFLVPGAAALVSQVAPEATAVWRTAFVIAGVAGAVGILSSAPGIARSGGRTAARLLVRVATPVYGLIVVVAVLPQLGRAPGAGLTGPQWEGILFCLLVLVGAQTAWTAAMAPSE
ncbi:hypothetical protein [Actinoplanes sp. M2I2]|uniref:hypothetical protein n=1 Tax=Actinoplanes sp. M2I2 TaxID=1734444 RepID=UPI002021429A|nr:hypothetical protein [Actinoplanes sp. M2I2]